ncbi:MAG: hypothetical protein WBP44_09300 [Gammaproteobacteria bacterium]|jgi:uncharacterized OsmC-like protein
MSERIFKMQMSCGYQEPDNMVASLQVRVFEDGEWKAFDLNVGSPGFLVFVYAVLSCQQLHMRLGCVDRGLHLDSADGDIEIVTTEDWAITKLQVAFSALLSEGKTNEEDVAAIVQRMKNCPVSRNLTFAAHSETRLEFRSS